MLDAKEYIPRSSVLLAIHDKRDLTEDEKISLQTRINAIPAADVRPIVRCRDCKTPHDRFTGCPRLRGLVTPPEFFCPWGERKPKIE